jgi:DNA-binding XRE family transcriptional regulator
MAKLKTSEHDNRNESKPQLETPSSLLNRLGANIQRLRKQQGLTSESLSAQTRAQAALGQSCPVDKKTISAIEAGKVDPSLTTIHAIAKALGVPIDVLVY